MGWIVLLALVTTSLCQFVGHHDDDDNMYNRIIVNYNTPTILTSDGWYGSIRLISDVMFNATLIMNDEIIAYCNNEIDCYMRSPKIWSKDNQYKAIILASNTKGDGESYFTIAYSWNANCPALLIMIFAAAIPLSLIVVVVIVSWMIKCCCATEIRSSKLEEARILTGAITGKEIRRYH
jgi:hypothetical protein